MKMYCHFHRKKKMQNAAFKICLNIVLLNQKMCWKVCGVSCVLQKMGQNTIPLFYFFNIKSTCLLLVKSFELQIHFLILRCTLFSWSLMRLSEVSDWYNVSICSDNKTFPPPKKLKTSYLLLFQVTSSFWKALILVGQHPVTCSNWPRARTVLVLIFNSAYRVTESICFLLDWCPLKYVECSPWSILARIPLHWHKTCFQSSWLDLFFRRISSGL